jgi:cobalt-zinc-cadmium efflux system membrane fusion protein
MLRFIKAILPLVVLAGIVYAGFATRQTWLPWVIPAKKSAATGGETSDAPAQKVLLSDQAIENLSVKPLALKTTTYTKSLTVPGMILDRPGLSDRGVVSPVIGIVQAMHHLPGSTVKPGDVLFTLRLLSETIHQTQSELYKTQESIKLTQVQLERLKQAGTAIPEVRMIEMQQNLSRLEVAANAARQELLSRGFTETQIAGVARGEYVREMQVVAPPFAVPRATVMDTKPDHYEMQELKVELGQQVQAGQTLCTLANHHHLLIEGRAFRDETPFLERAARDGAVVQVDFQEPPGSGWEPCTQVFKIEHIANTIDPVNRTFAFRLPLSNESRLVKQGSVAQTLWRFRPGQKVRLLVPVEEIKNVWVVPRDAVTREGAESYLFTQNVNTFSRLAVKVLLSDRTNHVLAADATVPPGTFIAANAATQINRMLKSASSGVPPGYHMHADGTLHKNGED